MMNNSQSSQIFEKFTNNYIPEPNSGCWLWTKSISPDGYGRINIGIPPGKSLSVHRWSYEYFKGPIPAGLTVDHLCRVRCCVNPYHLEVVTIAQNVLRGISFSARQLRQTHCYRGHPFDEVNTYRPPGRPRRVCKICRDLLERKYRERH